MAGQVIEDLGGSAGCAWCGCLIPLAEFSAHSEACERAVRRGQRSLFAVGGPRGLWDAAPAEDQP